MARVTFADLSNVASPLTPPKPRFADMSELTVDDAYSVLMKQENTVLDVIDRVEDSRRKERLRSMELLTSPLSQHVYRLFEMWRATYVGMQSSRKVDWNKFFVRNRLNAFYLGITMIAAATALLVITAR